MKSRKFPATLTSQLKWYLDRCSESDAAICRGAGIDQARLSRFRRGQRTITLHTADALAKHLGLKLLRVNDG